MGHRKLFFLFAWKGVLKQTLISVLMEEVGVLWSYCMTCLCERVWWTKEFVVKSMKWTNKDERLSNAFIVPGSFFNEFHEQSLSNAFTMNNQGKFENTHVKAWLVPRKTNKYSRDGNGTKSGSWVKLLNDRSLWQVTVKWACCSVLICVGWTNNDQSLLIAGSDEREFIDNDNECR